MASFSALDIMKITPKTNMEAEFDAMMIPHWSFYLTPIDVENLRRIATSKKYAGNMNLKYRMIDNIMKARGFARFSGGTNRVVYKYYEDTRFLVKIAVDSVGMKDNPAEYKNQFYLRPYCTKMFYVSPCGTVGFAERVLPITSINEFKLIADSVFDLLYYKIIGKYVIEDIGTKYFMNWGIRAGHGPVLLDYPYVFELDGMKIQCQNPMPDGSICNGEIDYDDGFNNLVCLKCGRVYNASELRNDKKDNLFVIRKGGEIPMNVKIRKGNEIITQSNSTSTIQKPKTNPRCVYTTKSTNTTVRQGGKIVAKIEAGNMIDMSQPRPAEVVKTTEFDIGADPEPAVEKTEEVVPAVETTEEATKEVAPEVETVKEEPVEEVQPTAEEPEVVEAPQTTYAPSIDSKGRKVFGKVSAQPNDEGDY